MLSTHPLTENRIKALLKYQCANAEADRSQDDKTRALYPPPPSPKPGIQKSNDDIYFFGIAVVVVVAYILTLVAQLSHARGFGHGLVVGLKAMSDTCEKYIEQLQ